MPRTAPSRADRKLMSLAAASGYPVSAGRLERWRRHGLIPSPDARRTGARGTEQVYPEGTGDLVCALARHTCPGHTYDLALLAFFSGAAVPEIALKTALARVYFKHRVRHEEQVEHVQAQVPPLWAAEMDSEDYEKAEAAAEDLAGRERQGHTPDAQQPPASARSDPLPA